MMFYDHARLTTEFHVKEVVRDVAFLHSEDMFAVAQKTNVSVGRGASSAHAAVTLPAQLHLRQGRHRAALPAQPPGCAWRGEQHAMRLGLTLRTRAWHRCTPCSSCRCTSCWPPWGAKACSDIRCVHRRQARWCGTRTRLIRHVQDTSTGAVVAELRTRLGHCEVMRQNPYNAVLHLGHANGARLTPMPHNRLQHCVSHTPPQAP